MFADDKYLFSVVHAIDTSANDLNHDLEKISEWTFQRKMNPEPTKQDQEIIFSKKKTVSIHLVGYFNNSLVNSTATHKHLGMIIDSKLSYENHIKEKSPAYLFQLIPENNPPILGEMFKRVNPSFQNKNKLIQKCFLSCSCNEAEYDCC